MSQFFESATTNMSAPIDTLPIGFRANIHDRVASYYKAKELDPSWQRLIHARQMQDLKDFFHKHASSFLCSGPWYLSTPIQTNSVDALGFVLSETKSFHINSPFTYCIGNKYRNFTPLQLACCTANFDVIKLLIAKGSDVTAVGNHRIVNLLFQHNITMDVLNLIPCIHHLVSCGAKVPKDCIYYFLRFSHKLPQSTSSQSPSQTHESESYFDVLSLIQYLHARGADLSYIATALDFRHCDVAQFMMDNGAHLDDNILRYVNRRHSFIWLFNHNLVRDVNHNNTYNGTALFFHAEKNHFEAVQVLLSYGADVNVRCKFSKITAIECAMWSGCDDLVKLLYQPASQYRPTPAFLEDLKSNKFAMLPRHPRQLKQTLIAYNSQRNDNGNGNGNRNNDDGSDNDNETKVCNIDVDESSELASQYAMVEASVAQLLRQLKLEYGKLTRLQHVRNHTQMAMKRNQNHLQLYDDFESLWCHWDIDCLVQWLKRVPFVRVDAFSAYWASDDICVANIERYLENNAQRFGVVENDRNDRNELMSSAPLKFGLPSSQGKKHIKHKSAATPSVAQQRRKFLDSLKLGPSAAPATSLCAEEEDKEEEKMAELKDDVRALQFKGEYLQFFDRYVFDRIGVTNEVDCDMVYNELMRLKRKYPHAKTAENGQTQIENDTDDKECTVCCQRKTSHILQCGHHFCEFCIDEFRKTTNRCAHCKAKITLVIKMY